MVKVLYLEDDDLIGSVMYEYLKLAGFDVNWQKNGSDAYDEFIKAVDDRYGIVILDIIVPGISGFEVLKKIRENDHEVGIIMLSVLEDDKTQLESLDMYADDYIIKPIPPILLIKKIKTLLRRINLNHVDTDCDSKNSSLVLDEEGSRFFEDKKDIGLTLTEFSILELLYKNKNKSFSREELLDRVYGDSYYGSDRVIDTHIKNLRKKLKQPYIKTVVGLGYRWNEEY